MVDPVDKIFSIGKRCGVNETGEICIKSPCQMLRYLKRPKETEEYFDFEEFCHTGDLGFYNQEGWITYVDRMKEVIKYKNNHVAPTEIEDILQKHEAVQESLVFGKKEPSVQELIAAVVIIKPDKKVSIQKSKQIFPQWQCLSCRTHRHHLTVANEN